jgi:hypothetical protein
MALFPPPSTILFVIDDLSNFLFSSLPTTTSGPTTANQGIATTPATAAANAQSKQQSARRANVISALSISLSQIASSRSIAVVVLNKCSTTQKPGQPAVLRSALQGQNWDLGVSARIVLYRDFPPSEVVLGRKLDDEERKRWRIAEVTRVSGKDVRRGGVPFTIRDDGLKEVIMDKQAESDRGKGKEVAREALLRPSTTDLLGEENINSDTPDLNTNHNPAAPPDKLQELTAGDHDALKPGLEDDFEPELPPMPEARLGKRKAIEIADSEDEDEGDGSEDNEPVLPRILSARSLHSQQEQEEEVRKADGEEEEEEEEMLLDQM